MKEKSANLHLGLWLFAILVAYWLSVGPFFLWEESATTYKQYRSRLKVRYYLFAPVRWLESADPTEVLGGLHSSYAKLWLNPNFEAGKLPPE